MILKINKKEEKFYKEAFEEYVNNQQMPSEEELGAVEFSPEFEENIQSLLNSKKPLKVVTPQKVLMKVASVAIVCVLLASAFVVGSFAQHSDKKENKIKKIIELYNWAMYDTGETYLCYALSYLPEGYIRNRPWYYGDDGPWKNEQGDVISFFERRYRSESQYYNSREYHDNLLLPEIDLLSDVYEKLDGGLYVFNSETGKVRYIWSAYGYVFEIRADNLSKEEILKIKKGLKNC